MRSVNQRLASGRGNWLAFGPLCLNEHYRPFLGVFIVLSPVRIVLPFSRVCGIDNMYPDLYSNESDRKIETDED